jgi:hypothetical protein
MKKLPRANQEKNKLMNSVPSETKNTAGKGYSRYKNSMCKKNFLVNECLFMSYVRRGDVGLR